MGPMKIKFATRPSALARWQTGWVIARLQEAWPDLECEAVVITTEGDRVLDKSLPEIGGKGVFTQELEAALLDGRVQAAVHSLKDLPTENPPGLCLGCIPSRGEVRDALISPRGWSLESLPQGARLGTSSLRRSAQAAARRPDLRIQSLRGNVDTRLRKVLEGQFEAIILAGAGLIRLGLQDHVTQWLPLEVMLPAPGQGALAVQCRCADPETLGRLAALEDREARRETTAERAFLAGLGSGCALPVAAHAVVSADSQIRLTGSVASTDGRRLVRVQGEGSQASELGSRLAQEALSQGARELLSGAMQA
jgi:hydroxymethylbilane synthase